MEFIIDTKKWYRGKGIRHSKLLLSNGQMCCLGQIASQCGIPKKILKGQDMPHCLDAAHAELFTDTFASVWHDTVMSMATVNDNKKISDEMRMKILQDTAQAFGHTLTFV